MAVVIAGLAAVEADSWVAAEEAGVVAAVAIRTVATVVVSGVGGEGGVAVSIEIRTGVVEEVVEAADEGVVVVAMEVAETMDHEKAMETVEAITEAPVSDHVHLQAEEGINLETANPNITENLSNFNFNFHLFSL